MENFKFVLFSIITIVLLGVGGYWAFSTMESGSGHVDSQKLKNLEQENSDMEREIASLKREITLLEAKQQEEPEQVVVENKEPQTTTPTKTTVLKYQTLINELQKLVDGNIYLKSKSQGPAVGTVQKFLNIYNNTSSKIDNDYGASTATAIKSFQKAVGLTQDGETGPNTYKKMISWLKTK